MGVLEKEAQKSWILEEAADAAVLANIPADVLIELYPEYDSGPCYYRKAEFRWLTQKIIKAFELTEVPFETDLNFKQEWEDFTRPILRADLRPLQIDQIRSSSIPDILSLAPMLSLTGERKNFTEEWITDRHSLPFPLWTNKWKSRVQIEGVNAMNLTLYLLIIDPTLGNNIFLPASIMQAQDAYSHLLTAFESLEEPDSWKERDVRLWEPKPVRPN